MNASRQSSPVKKIFIAGSAFFLLSPALLSLLPSATTSNEGDSPAQRQARNASAFAIMLGEFRTNLGDMLFVKTERYLDSGVGYEPHIDERAMAKTGSADAATSAGEMVLENKLSSPEINEALSIKPGTVASHAEEDNHDHADDAASDHEGHDHEGHDHSDHEGHDHDDSVVRTLIKTADSDFRGFIGSLERQVKPWRDPSDPHQHTAGTELLPWYRLATLSDPHNVRNYMIGAWWLKSMKTEEQRNEALKYLNEGVASNPNAYELYLMQGYVLRDMGKLREAREKFRVSADLAITHRPPGGADSTSEWDITDDEQLAAAMTMDVMMTRDMESTATAIHVTHDYIKRIPTEGSLSRMLGQLQSGN